MRRILLFFVAFIVTIFFVTSSATVVLGVFVSGSDAIFPNVTAEGADLSGLTVAEAGSVLRGIENNAAAVAVTVYFPDGTGFFISGDDAGLLLCAEEVALKAFGHGRGGSFFDGIHMYLRSLLVRTYINGVPVLDKDFVRGEVAVHTQIFNDSRVANPSYTVSGSSLTISPASGFAPADTDSVFYFAAQSLYAALEEGTHLVVYYFPEAIEPVYFDLRELYDRVRTEPVSAVLDKETGDVVESVPGVGFDLDDAVYRLENARPGEEIIIPLIFTEPEISTEDLQERLFRDVLAERTTRVAGTAARYGNISLAASYIDGIVLNPGEIFSFNEIVGRRTAERGFRPAGGFRDGRQVDMIGGGICQVSSSLYDNVLHAYLEVVARRAHTLPIAYLPLGHDAAIYYGVLDLRFANNTDYPIKIEIEFDGRNMTTRFLGTRTDDYVIRIESRRTAIPFQTVYREDADVTYNTVYFNGANGAIAYTYRIIYDADGEQISRTRIARDVYRTQPRVVLVPAAVSPPPAQYYYANLYPITP